MNDHLVLRVRDALGTAPCVVAVGGGADSAALLHAAAQSGNPVRGVFVHHHLSHSDLLAAAARAIAAHTGTELAVVDAPVVEGSDLEARARAARYRVLEQHLEPGERCCTAHTLDDQAETVLIRLMRGSGPVGLSGIPSTRGPFCRPFLTVRRAELRAVADATGLPYTDDPSNRDDRFLRSRIRSHLMPLLTQQYDESIVEDLARSADLVAAQHGVIVAMASEIPVHISDDSTAIPTAPLLTAPLAAASEAVRRALTVHLFPYHGSHADVSAVLATARDGTTRTLTGGLVCGREGPHVVVAPKVEQDAPTPVSLEAGVLAWGPWRFAVSLSDAPALMTTVGRRTAVSIRPGDEAVMRCVTNGDRLDMSGQTTPVAELLRAAGVPPRLRSSWPAIAVNGKIAAVAGIRVADWARPGPGEAAMVIEREGPM
ncbi:MAG: tRNA lysidine(34) synthetase TilS [Acidimicrobiia bacterium]